MKTTIFIGIILLIGIAALILSAKQGKKSSTLFSPLLVGLAALAVGAIVLGFSSTTIVKPRTVGVKVALGKPIKVLENGFHLKFPWESVEKLDGSVQNNIYAAESAVSVRLGNNGKASVDASIQWQLKTDDAMSVFLDYKTFEGIQSNLVDRNFKAALNEVMANYDPLDYSNAATGGKDLASLATEVTKKMTDKVGAQIEIRSVTLPIINFDDPTQNRINELQSETAKTRVAQQKKETSAAEAAANKMLEASLTQETLTSKCLDIVAESKQSPIGCFSGAGVQPITMVGENTRP